MLPLTRASKQSYFKLLCSKMRENGKPALLDEPRTNNSTKISKKKKQRNTVVFWAIVACTKPELQVYHLETVDGRSCSFKKASVD